MRGKQVDINKREETRKKSKKRGDELERQIMS